MASPSLHASRLTRTLLTMLLAGVLWWPVATADAQPATKVWRIGLFHVGLDHVPPSLETLRAGLKALGYAEGRNIHLDWRNLADEEAARVTAQAFVRNRVDLIVAFENQTVRAAMAATTEIPIVFLHVTDPVADGFVKTMSHPGANLTGFVGLADLPGKRLELFKEMVPRLRRVLVLIDPQDPTTGRLLSEAREVGRALKVHLVEQEATTQADLERLFGELKRRALIADGILPLSPNLLVKFPSLMIRLAAEAGLPLATYRGEWVEAGALFSYAHDLAAVGPLAARYMDRILKGASPGNLPVEEPSKFELVINLATAQQMGLTIPPEVLMRADRVVK
jgi:putative ABC transport system substrate-binding protein